MWKEPLALVLFLAGGLAVVGQDPPAVSFRQQMQARPDLARALYKRAAGGKGGKSMDSAIDKALGQRFTNIANSHDMAAPLSTRRSEVKRLIQATVSIIDMQVMANAEMARMLATIADLYPDLVSEFGKYPPD